MTVSSKIEQFARQGLIELFQRDEGIPIQVNDTKPEFAGDYTVVLFSLVKSFRISPEKLGIQLGNNLIERNPEFFSSYSVIKGFLNLSIADSVWIDFLSSSFDDHEYGKKKRIGKKVMIEYSSPNTNKPLHLGHLRNIFLGWSVAEIFNMNGYDVVKTCIANDRGIHICKSMMAWKLFAKGATPASTGIKGDHFVGDYYVLFNEELKKQVEELVSAGLSKEEAEKESPLMKGVQQMLVDWEAGSADILELWQTMNKWVYAGFDATYRRLDVDFDKIYYESNTYLLGKGLVEFGLRQRVFFQKPDASVWIDLTAEGLDEKIVQRKDGTAVYITQDIGLAQLKAEEYSPDLSIYVVGDEQNYHFKVLKLICQKLSIPAADKIFHLSYGMVELPSGRMKTREGTVVDADDLLDEMHNEAKRKTQEQGKTEGIDRAELETLYELIGTGGLRFFLLRVDPKKRMVFNPEESIDLHGYTATFVQYAYARIKSILRKDGVLEVLRNSSLGPGNHLLPLEKALLVQIEKFPAMVDQACLEMNPSLIANFAFVVAKTFNSFYAEHSVAQAETLEKKVLRVRLANFTANILHRSMRLLGINLPERM
ncbi:MAG TPA: arginine--tRNA ligase [Puia sp.]|nr:arginine--tRNA ligase [Puia sp.]